MSSSTVELRIPDNGTQLFCAVTDAYPIDAHDVTSDSQRSRLPFLPRTEHAAATAGR